MDNDKITALIYGGVKSIKIYKSLLIPLCKFNEIVFARSRKAQLNLH